MTISDWRQAAALASKQRGIEYETALLFLREILPAAVCATAALILSLPTTAPAQDSGASKHYTLPATSENVQWGWYDVNEKPRLTIKSGDTVSIETLPHALGQIKPGVAMDEIVKLRKENPGGGPHSITGPVYVEGAEPGDTLEIHIYQNRS